MFGDRPNLNLKNKKLTYEKIEEIIVNNMSAKKEKLGDDYSFYDYLDKYSEKLKSKYPKNIKDIEKVVDGISEGDIEVGEF